MKCRDCGRELDEFDIASGCSACDGCQLIRMHEGRCRDCWIAVEISNKTGICKTCSVMDEIPKNPFSCWYCAGMDEPDRSNARSGCRMNDRQQDRGPSNLTHLCFRPKGSILAWNEQEDHQQ